MTTSTEARLDLLETQRGDADRTIEEIGRHVGSLKDLTRQHADMLDKVRIIEDKGPANDKLFTALSKAQAEIENAQMDATNPHYGSQYASLDSVLSAVRPALTKHGLCLIQMPRYEVTEHGTLIVLETILGHSSGQEIRNYFSMYPPKQDPQGIGSCLTYMRRYTVMAICGIAGAYDDDAEGAAGDPATISAAEADEILALADELFDGEADALLERMCDKIFGVESVPKIPEGQGGIALQRIKNTRARKDREAAGEGGDKKPVEEKPAADKKPASKPTA